MQRRMGVGRKGEGSGRQEQVARVSNPKAVLPPAKGEEEKISGRKGSHCSKALVAQEWRKWVEHRAETAQFWPTLSPGTNGPRREAIGGCLPTTRLSTGLLFLCCLACFVHYVFSSF